MSVTWAIEQFFLDIMTYRLNGPTSSALLSELESSNQVYPFDLYTVRRSIANMNNSTNVTIELWNGRIPDRFIIKFIYTRNWDGKLHILHNHGIGQRANEKKAEALISNKLISGITMSVSGRNHLSLTTQTRMEAICCLLLPIQ